MAARHTLAKIFAYCWLTLAVAAIVVGIGTIWYTRGFGAVQMLMSPFNFVYYIVVVVTVAPGVWLLDWAERSG